MSASSLSVIPTEPDLRSSTLYLNRELSWLEFNARVLSESQNEAVPLLERLKFHAIVASNLDEFFMVRVAGLKQQLTGEVGEGGPDGMSVSEQLSAIAKRVHDLADKQADALMNDLMPKLAEKGILVVKPEQLSPEAQRLLDDRFTAEIYPILTPLAIDPGHPFPHLRNKSLNLGVMFTRDPGGEGGFGVVQVPMMLPRLLDVTAVRADGSPARHAFVLVEDVIARHVSSIFPGVKLKGVYAFRVTRNFDLEIDEEEAEDLLQTIQQELRRRERGNAVRLEVSGVPTGGSLAKLVKALKLDPDRDVYRTTGMLNVSDLIQIVGREDRRDLRDEPFQPLAAPPLREADDPFAVIREGDVLLHHPYEAFDSVVELIQRAADDPDVLAIKQTLYRAGGDSPIVKALARAAEAGKQVTAIVEQGYVSSAWRLCSALSLIATEPAGAASRARAAHAGEPGGGLGVVFAPEALQHRLVGDVVKHLVAEGVFAHALEASFLVRHDKRPPYYLRHRVRRARIDSGEALIPEDEADDGGLL